MHWIPIFFDDLRPDLYPNCEQPSVWKSDFSPENDGFYTFMIEPDIFTSCWKLDNEFNDTMRGICPRSLVDTWYKFMFWLEQLDISTVMTSNGTASSWLSASIPSQSGRDVPWGRPCWCWSMKLCSFECRCSSFGIVFIFDLSIYRIWPWPPINVRIRVPALPGWCTWQPQKNRLQMTRGVRSWCPNLWSVWPMGNVKTRKFVWKERVLEFREALHEAG